MKTFRQRACSLLLALLTVLAMFPVSAFAEEGAAAESGITLGESAPTQAAEPGIELVESAPAAASQQTAQAELQLQYLPDEGALPENDELFAAYVQQAFEEPIYGGSSLFASAAGNRLPAIERGIYNELKEAIGYIADGVERVAQFHVDISSANLSWTKEQLGVDAIWASEGLTAEAGAALSQKFAEAVNIDRLFGALLADLPYNLYWYDKTLGTSISTGISGTEEQVGIPSITFTFTVAGAYADSSAGNDYTTDVMKTSATYNAVNRARTVVNTYSGNSDLAKLEAYRSYICSAVSYNDDAIKPDYAGGYGDPWQLIYVFDDNPTTNVVCEGYAKAFQYLCDLSTFEDPTALCYSVTGTMSGGTGAGAHMWNVMTLGGKNYLVDVTNCDSGTIGAPNLLFLKGVAGTEENRIHTFNVGGRDIIYTYDANEKDLFCAGYLALDEGDPTAIAEVNVALTAPATGETAQTAVSGANYTGTVSWSPALPESGKFEGGKTYTATITLTPNTDYHFDVPDGSVKVNGAAPTEVSTNVPSGITLRKTFPATVNLLTGINISFNVTGITVPTGGPDQNNTGSILMTLTGNYSDGRINVPFTSENEPNFYIVDNPDPTHIYFDGHNLTISQKVKPDVDTVTVKAEKGDIWTAYDVPVLRDTPAAAALTISGSTTQIDVPKRSQGPKQVAEFSATVYDQYGLEMTGQQVEWSVSPVYDGLSVDSYGVLRANYRAEQGRATIQANCVEAPSVFATRSIPVVRSAPVPDSIAMGYTFNHIVPEADSDGTPATATYDYTVTVYDQYYNIMPGAAFTTSLRPCSMQGVSINGNRLTWNSWVQPDRVYVDLASVADPTVKTTEQISFGRDYTGSYLRPTFVTIGGPNTIIIPSSGSNSITLTASAADQYAMPLTSDNTANEDYSVNWELVGTAPCCSINNNGVLSVTSLASDGSVTVKATVTANGATKSVTKTIQLKHKTDALASWVRTVSTPVDAISLNTGDLVAQVSAAAAAEHGTWSWTSNAPGVLAVSGNTATPELEVRSIGTATITGAYESETYYGTVSVPIIINKAKVYVPSGITASNKVYDGTADAVIDLSGAVLVGVREGDTVGFTAEGQFADVHVSSAPKTINIQNYALTGADAWRYAFDTARCQSTTTAKITPRPLTVRYTGTALTRVYDGTAYYLTSIPLTLVGLVPADAGGTIQVLTGTFNSANVGEASYVTPASMNISGFDSRDYTYELPQIPATITPAPLTFSYNGSAPITKVYDGTTVYSPAEENRPELTISGLVGDDAGGRAWISGGEYDSSEVQYASKIQDVSIDSGFDRENYSWPALSFSAKITPRPLTITYTGPALTKVYDGTAVYTADIPLTMTGLVARDVQNGAALKVPGGSFDDKNVGIDKRLSRNPAVISGSGFSLTNYSWTMPTLSATITPAPLTITYTDPPITKVYDGTTNYAGEISFALSGLVSSEESGTLTADGGTFNSADVEDADTLTPGELTANGFALTNYRYTVPTLNASITPAPLTFSYNGPAITKVYDGYTLYSPSVANRPELTLSGLVPRDAAGKAWIFQGLYDHSEVETASELEMLSFSYIGFNHRNYSWPTTRFPATITPAPLTITYNGPALTKVYDGNADYTAEIPLTMTGLISFDRNGTLTAASGTFNSADVLGANTLTPGTLTATGFTLANYSYTVPTLSATITPAPLTVTYTGTAPTKVYDGTTNYGDEVSFVLSGLVSSEASGTLTAAGGAFNSPDVLGANTLTPGTLTATGFTLTNYRYTVPELNASITPHPLEVTISGPAAAVYGEAFAHTAIGNDLPGFSSTYFDVCYNGSATKPQNVASYALTAVSTNPNFSVGGYSTGSVSSFDITPATPEINLNDTRLLSYGDSLEKSVTPADLSASVPGTLTVLSVSDDSDILADVSATGVPLDAVSYRLHGNLTPDDVGREAVIQLRFTPADSVNYLAVGPITYRIKLTEKASIDDISVSLDGVEYGQTLGAPTATTAQTGGSWSYYYAGVLDDGLNTPFGGASNTTPPTLPGRYTVTAVYENSTHLGSGSSSFVIGKKQLSYTGLTVADKVYNGLTDAKLVGTLAYAGVQPGDVLAAPGYTGAAFADAQVGSGKLVTVTGLTALSGADAWKYLAPTGLTLTGSITAPTAPSATGEEDKRIVSNTLETVWSGYGPGITGSYADADAAKEAMLEKAKETIPTIGSNLAYYDLKVEKTTDGGLTWNPAAGGATVLFPYPAGTNSRTTFVVVHMKADGTLETPPVTNGPYGFSVTVSSTSPFAVAWRVGSEDSGESSSDFWQTVANLADQATAGDNILVEAGHTDNLSWQVMQALRSNPGVSMEIRWAGGDTITIPAGKALADEPGRIYYPLAYLAQQYQGAAAATGSQNPTTGGEISLSVSAPAINGVKLDAYQPTPATEGIDQAQATLETTPYEPAQQTAPVVSGQQRPAQNGWFFAVLAAILLLLAAGGFWLFKKYRAE